AVRGAPKVRRSRRGVLVAFSIVRGAAPVSGGLSGVRVLRVLVRLGLIVALLGLVVLLGLLVVVVALLVAALTGLLAVLASLLVVRVALLLVDLRRLERVVVLVDRGGHGDLVAGLRRRRGG